MPGLIAHYICGQKVLERLPKEAGLTIEAHRKLYNIGCQGGDIFFYYLAGTLRKNMRGIGGRMHKERVGRFMGMMAKEVVNLHGDERHAAFAYFSGYLTHYALDCAVHPYVYHHAGLERTLKCAARHFQFEAAIDTLLFKNMMGKRPGDEKLWKLVEVDKKEAYGVAEVVGRVVNEVYGVDICGGSVLSAMGSMRFLTMAMQSRKGLRKRLLAMIERLFLGTTLASNIIHTQNLDDGVDYLNEGRGVWENPWGGKHVESFAELFELACGEAAEFIWTLWKYMENDIPLEDFLDKVGDRSFTTGLAAETLD